MDEHPLWIDHLRATRRYFLRFGAAGAAAFSSLPVAALEAIRAQALHQAISDLGPWLTRQDDFQDVSRGNPKPHSISDQKRKEVGLTRETWQLDVVSDPDHPSRLRNPLSRADGTAFDFAALLELGKKYAVRFPKVMTCLNIGCPLGNGIWEGVPLREVLWLTQPTQDLRRVFYHGFHNDDESQLFRSSLPVGRVLEDFYGLPPVILCYKLNGQWLTPERGGPVRMVVPEAYGFKSIKWLTHVSLSNLAHANDTYAEKNNDVDSPMKTFCATLSLPETVRAGQPIPIAGWAQAGVAGLAKVQVWIQDESEPWPGGRDFSEAPWRDAEILPPPNRWQDWGWENKAENQLPETTIGFDAGVPSSWPLRLTRAHWATLHPGLPAGHYVLRCRTIDEQAIPQPMPRPFRKSGHAAIQERQLVID
jgi:DMSO/TMAO reductase YedYZ molybdopterin-dependent catalytic subunit